jgi:hypothetical protein
MAFTEDSRAAYASLKDHFLRFIEHPEQLGSTVDPLNDDENVSQLSHFLLLTIASLVLKLTAKVPMEHSSSGRGIACGNTSRCGAMHA